MRIFPDLTNKAVNLVEGNISLQTITRTLICLIVLWLLLVSKFIWLVTQDEQMVDDIHLYFTGEYRQKYVFKNAITNNQLTPPFPIDIVYTWAGEIHMNDLNNTYVAKHVDKINKRQHTILAHLRYNNELKYSLRSVYKYIPWVRKIYLIHNDDAKCPSWINYTKVNQYNQYIDDLFDNLRKNYSKYLYEFQHSKLKQNIIGFECLNASTIFENKLYGAQTHSSQSFELRLHRINGLSKHYIYLNDDFFIFRKISYLFFFNKYGIPRYPAVYWAKYKNATLQKIYNDKAVSDLNIKFDIPYTITGFKLFVEHMPRPYVKSNWMALENKYKKWFNFTEKVHIEGNFCPSSKIIGCFNDNPHNILLAYRKLALNDTDPTQKSQNVFHIYNELGYKFVEEFKFEPFNHSMPQKYIHIWVTGSKNKFNNTVKMDYLLDRIERFHPITFNMNDVWHDNLTVYTMQLQRLLHFFERNFPDDGYI